VKPVALALTALLLLAAGCPNEKADALRAAIAKLKEERVEASTIEKAKQEAAEAEAALAATLTQLEDANTEFAKREAERDQTRAAIDAELARNARLRGEIDAVAGRAQDRAAYGQELDAQIAAVRERATWVRDQAAVLARELRPGDVAWASKRRLDSLAEFSERVAKEYADDPVATGLARQAIRSEAPSAEQVRIGAEQAARLRDRFAAVYELPSPDVAASAPVEAAPASDAPAEGTP
jgi:small-conductance mechanosensitive channel